METKNKVGRPKGSVAGHTAFSSKMKESFVKHVKKKLKKYIGAVDDLALGHLKEGITITGAKRVYTKSPDVNMLKYVFDQGIGKPQESLKLSGELKTIPEAVKILEGK